MLGDDLATLIANGCSVRIEPINDLHNLDCSPLSEVAFQVTIECTRLKYVMCCDCMGAVEHSCRRFIIQMNWHLPPEAPPGARQC